jgi:predicted ATPase
LRDRPWLVVVDNCEHLRDAVAEVITELLAKCASLGVLATSRAPLRVRDDMPMLVRPLTLLPVAQD